MSHYEVLSRLLQEEATLKQFLSWYPSRFIFSEIQKDVERLLQKGIDISDSILRFLEKEGLNLVCAYQHFGDWEAYKKRVYISSRLFFPKTEVSKAETFFLPYVSNALFGNYTLPYTKHLYTNAVLLSGKDLKMIFPNLESVTTLYVLGDEVFDETLTLRLFNVVLNTWSFVTKGFPLSDYVLSDTLLDSFRLPLHTLSAGLFIPDPHKMPTWRF